VGAHVGVEHGITVGAQRAVAQRDAGMQYLKYDPVLENLRSDPRYARMLQQVGLPD
jgi:hypothetical protein